MAPDPNIRRFARQERQLFLDDADVAEIHNLQTCMQRPNKKGALIRSDPSTVLLAQQTDGPAYRPQTRTAPVWDPQAGLWKFWSIGAKLSAEAGRSSYHESRDGLHWYQPALGQVEVDGSTANNFVCIPIDDTRTSEVLGVVYDALDPDPNRRFKAITFTMLPEHSIFFAVSPDGIAWTRLHVPPILSGDEPNFSFDSINHQFIATVKVRGPYGRSHALTTSEDFEHWSEPQLVFHADDEDQELARSVIAQRLATPALQQTIFNHPQEHGVDVYNFAISRYESRYIGFASMFHHVGRNPTGRNHDGFHHVQLASSRDMYTWERLGKRAAFIDSSPLGAGAYDTLQILGPSSPVVRDDELWFYYTGITFRWPPQKWDPDNAAICLATLRRDGFVSLDATEEGGSLTTVPFQWQGEQLFFNADADRGTITVEVLDVAGRPLAGFSQEESIALTDNSVRQRIVWRERSRMPDPANGAIRLRINLTNAQLYSYWFE